MNSEFDQSKASSDSTILDYFLKWEKETPTAVLLRQPIAELWKEFTWRQVGETSRKILASLRSRGIKKGDRVAILSQNCAEGIMCDIAMMMGGFISVPLYANVNAATMKDILIHSESRLLFIGKLLSKDWENQQPAIPSTVITVTLEGYEKKGITAWNEFINNSSGQTTPERPTVEEILTIIYTSGTTGVPKGVVHTHGSVINALHTAADEVLLNQRGNRFLSYLPLSHAAERGLVEFGSIYSGGSISFVETPDRFAATIQHVKPTHFFGVPRIWEKFQSKILESLPQKKLNMLLAIPVVSGIIKSKIKKALGLEKAVVILTGAAPISPALMIWFQKIGIYIREAYGMSENFNVCTINPRDQIRIGFVGKLFKNQEVVIDPDTHEIKQRCSWIMQGYYKDPEQTAATIVNGFLHTGDMGEVSADGFLKLTGRVKDIFKTSKGEYIVPGKNEMQFLELPAVDQACVMGMKYPQPFVIVVLSEVGKGMDKNSVTNLLNLVLQAANSQSMEYQKLKKVIVVKDEWTPDNGLLTPTLKMKRNSLSAKYEVALEQVYHSDEIVSWE